MKTPAGTHDRCTVSVIIPAHNAELSLRASIESAIRQTLAPHEIIVVDDGSTDSTARVAKGYGSRVAYIAQANLGQGAARNAGLSIATGDYIAFLDSDDYWRPTFLEQCLAFMQVHAEAVAVSTGLSVQLTNGNEVTLPAWVRERQGDAGFVVENFFAFWAEHDHVRTGSALIRHSVIRDAGPQCAHLRVSQDLEYWGYLATFGKWGFIPKALWVGTSTVVARKVGWRRKYQKRRRLCPSVEAWQERILPRLNASELADFRVVRGRVALSYAHNKILGGDTAGARLIVQTYGNEMPRNHLSALLRLGSATGWPGWLSLCGLVHAREAAKGL